MRCFSVRFDASCCDLLSVLCQSPPIVSGIQSGVLFNTYLFGTCLIMTFITSFCRLFLELLTHFFIQSFFFLPEILSDSVDLCALFYCFGQDRGRPINRVQVAVLETL